MILQTDIFMGLKVKKPDEFGFLSYKGHYRKKEIF